MKIEEYLKKYDVVYYVIDRIQTKCKGFGKFDAKYCTNQETNSNLGHEFCWQNTKILYAFFCYCVTKVCEEHGYNIYRGGKGCTDINWKRFEMFFPIGPVWNKAKLKYTENKGHDRKDIIAIKEGYRPKGAEELEKIIRETLQNFFTQPQ